MKKLSFVSALISALLILSGCGAIAQTSNDSVLNENIVSSSQNTSSQDTSSEASSNPASSSSNNQSSESSSEDISTSSEDSSVHNHTFASTYLSNSTHHWHPSTCGHDVVEGKEEHTFSTWATTKEASAEEDGSKQRTCTVCGYVETQVTHEHEYELKHDDTNHFYICRCGDILEKQAHNFDQGVITKQPNALYTGVKTFTCLTCGHTKTVTLAKNSTPVWSVIGSDSSWNNDHDMEVNNQGLYEITLPFTNGTEFKIRKNHDWATNYGSGGKNGANIKVTTYLKHPVTITFNTSSGAINYKEVVDHDLGDYVASENEHYQLCSLCNNKINKANHSFVIKEVIKEPTETVDGEAVYMCSVCHYEKNDVLLYDNYHEHTYSNELTYDEHSHWYPSTCGHDVKKNEENHTFSNWIVTKEATATEKGLQERTCNVCGYKQEEEIALHEHTFATGYSSDGTHHWHPSTCGHDVKKDVEAHDFDDGVVIKEPTYTTEGTKKYTCTVCSYDKYETIEKLPSYLVYLDLNGGTSVSLNNQQGTIPFHLAQLNKTDLPLDITKTGYKFVGWSYEGEIFLDQNGVVKKTITPTDNMSIKAEFSDAITLTIKYELYSPRYTDKLRDLTYQEVTSSVGDISGTQSVAKNGLATLHADLNPGYEFLGWYYGNSRIASTADFQYTVQTSNITLTARIRYKTFEVTAYSDGFYKDLGAVSLIRVSHWSRSTSFNGNVVEEKEYSDSESTGFYRTITDAFYSQEMMAKAETTGSARFLGWYDINNNLLSTNPIYYFNMVDYNYSIFAKWNYFEVTYEMGGAQNDPDNPDSYTVEDGIIPLKDPVTYNYATYFVGWYLGDAKVDSINTSLRSDITLTPRWITYSTNISYNSSAVVLKDTHGGIHPIGTKLTYEVKTIYPGYEFDGYYIDDVLVCNQLEYTFTTLDQDVVIELRMVKDFYLENFNFDSGYQQYNNNSPYIRVTSVVDTSVETLYFPHYVTSIDDGVFSSCPNLKRVILTNASNTLPYNLETVIIDKKDVSWDYNEARAKNLVLTTTVQSITTSYKNTNIENVYYNGTIEQWCRIDFTNYYNNPINNGAKLYLLDDENGEVEFNDRHYTQVVGNLVIPETVRYIKQYQFYGLKNVTEITLVGDKVSIGASAFGAMPQVTKITLPFVSSMTHIGDIFNTLDNYYAMENGRYLYGKITSADLNYYVPAALRTIDLLAGILPTRLSGTRYDLYINTDNYSVITDASTSYGSAENVYFNGTIIDWIDHTSFSHISNNPMSWANHFYYRNSNNEYEEISVIDLANLKSREEPYVVKPYTFCKFVTELLIGDGVEIQENAFQNCYMLKKIASSATYDKSDALYSLFGNVNLDTLIIKNDSWEGYNSIKFKNVVLEQNDYSITGSLFSGSGVTNIYYYGSLKDWLSLEFEKAWYNPFYHAASGNNFFLLDENGEVEFEGKKYSLLTEFVPDSSITEIGPSQFFNVDSLKRVVIPSTVVSVGGSAFNSSGVTSFTLESANTILGNSVVRANNDGYAAYYGPLFENMGKALDYITHLYITTDESVIPSGFFTNNSTNYHLTTVVIEGPVEEIGMSAFSGCSKLSTIRIPGTVKKIGSYALRCSLLNEIYFDGTFEDWKKIEMVSNDGNPLYYAKHLYLLNENGDKTFEGKKYKELTQIVIPYGTTKIEEGEYAYYHGVTSVRIPETVTSIGSDAFFKSDSIVNIYFDGDSQLTSIGSYAFYCCTNLKSITIVDGITIIPTYCFCVCTNLETITIPASVTYFGQEAFLSCTSLKNIYFLGTKEQWGNITKAPGSDMSDNRWNRSIPTTIVHCSDGDRNIY